MIGHRPSRRGFTLLELLLVLVMAGVMAALVASRVGAGSLDARRRDAVRSIERTLAEARVTAMRHGHVQSVTLEWTPESDAFTVAWNGREQQWEGLAMAPVNDEGQPLARTEARFDIDGRTDRRAWRFMARPDAATIWLVRFDPVSGSPRLMRPGDADDVAAGMMRPAEPVGSF